MSFRVPVVRLTALVIVTAAAACSAGPPRADADAAQTAQYEDLVALFREWREFQKPRMNDGVPDYSPQAMRAQYRDLAAFVQRLDAIDSSAWSISQRVDYRLVRAEMNGLEFDHRVLRPWARNPVFYRVLHASDTDVPLREGSVMHGVTELWTYEPPLSVGRLAELRVKLRAIPAVLDQARMNLVEDAADLWFLGLRVKRNESLALADFAAIAGEHHPDLLPDLRRARAAVDDFAVWLEEHQREMTKSSGIGVENYTWYLNHVQLVPYTWEEELAIAERELARAWADLSLLENRNRELPPLDLVASAEEYREEYAAAVQEFVGFLEREEFFTVPEYADDALMAREGRFVPSDGAREFFTEVNYRDLRVMRAHGTHWFDLARMEREPHPSPIRRVPSLYNIWAYRAEGLATAMEEMAMRAGYLDGHPRSQELVYVLLAQRAARAVAALRMHANEFTLEEAVGYATAWTPRGWLAEDGNTVWTEQGLYLEQPGYGSSYIVGKVQIERLLADRASQLGEDFDLRRTMDEFHAAGMIPVSLIRWEMAGEAE